MNTERIVRDLRIRRNPRELINEDVGALTERVVSKSGPASIRAEITRYFDELYSEISAILGREHELNVAARLALGTARSKWRVLLTVLAEMQTWDTLTGEQRDYLAALLAEHAIPLDPDEDPATREG